MRPELLHRMDAAIVFRALDERDYRTVAERQLSALAERAAVCGCRFSWSSEAEQLLVARADTLHAGARGIRTCVAQSVEPLLAEHLLHRQSHTATVQPCRLCVREGEWKLEQEQPMIC